uniref:Uncharacterized protein n=1 Tax=Anguilla anguilla TaxID=7936 RepID=A0A0E9R8W1_ANGAN
MRNEWEYRKYTIPKFMACPENTESYLY